MNQETYQSDSIHIRISGNYVLIDLGPKESAELKTLLARALNTMPPEKAPKWAIWLSDKL